MSRGDTKIRLIHPAAMQQQQQQSQPQQPTPSNQAIFGSINSGITPLIIGSQLAGIPTTSTNLIIQNPLAAQSALDQQQQSASFLGGIFNKRERKLSRSDDVSNNGGRSTEV